MNNTHHSELQPKEIFSINEAAAFCGISRAFLYRKLQSGTGPARLIKIGKRTLLARSDLIAWLESQSQTTRKEEPEHG